MNMYCESLEKAQSHTHFSEPFLRVFLRLKSAVDQILHVPSADVVAKRLNKQENPSLNFYFCGINQYYKALYIPQNCKIVVYNIYISKGLLTKTKSVTAII